MSPERAWERANDACKQALGGNAKAPQWVISAIIAACREERHAALTEAAMHVDETAQMPGLTHDQVIAIKGVVLRLMALRDKEQP